MVLSFSVVTATGSFYAGNVQSSAGLLIFLLFIHYVAGPPL
jgi:hypothetical protein